MTDPQLNSDVPGLWGLITQIRDLLNGFPGARYQFGRVGYFCVDRDSTPEKLVFNRTVTLRDTWAKIEKAMSAGG